MRSYFIKHFINPTKLFLRSSIVEGSWLKKVWAVYRSVSTANISDPRENHTWWWFYVRSRPCPWRIMPWHIAYALVQERKRETPVKWTPTRDTHRRIILGVRVKSVGEERDKSFAFAFVARHVFTRLRRRTLGTFSKGWTEKSAHIRETARSFVRYHFFRPKLIVLAWNFSLRYLGLYWQSFISNLSYTRYSDLNYRVRWDSLFIWIA